MYLQTHTVTATVYTYVLMLSNVINNFIIVQNLIYTMA